MTAHLAQPVLPFAEPTPIRQRRTRVRFLNLAQDVLLDTQAEGRESHARLVESRRHDALADAHVAAMDRALYRIAQIAYCNDRDPIWREVLDLALRGRTEYREFLVDDRAEAECVVTAGGIVAGLVKRCRAACAAISKELTKRGAGR